MKRALVVILKLIVLMALLFIAVIGLNYFNSSIKTTNGTAAGEPAPAGTTLSILNWNLGYAGLGKESDFVMDGGENLLPPSKAIVQKNLAGIQSVLNANKSDFVLIQEVSTPDMLNLGVNVLQGVQNTLKEYSWQFSTDMRTQFIPQKWALHHGLAHFSRLKSSKVSLLPLPLEPTRLGNIIQRQYHIQARELTDSNGKEWAILNLHLSAFDEGGNIRMKQLNQVIEIANQYFLAGKHVVIGGDWNMQLAPTNFANTTKQEDLFWLAVFPHENLKTDWKIVVDPAVPTVRSNERPYQQGENYTTVIDGFLISPNVETLSIKTINTDFEYTDHQPVHGVFTAK